MDTLQTETSPLFTQYNNLNAERQKAFRDLVKNVLKRASRQTVRNWVNGKNSPREAEKIVIAQFFETTVSELFPTK